MESKSSSIPVKKYKVGMYGGKFMPLHKGHLRCLQIAAEECELVYFILFYGGNQENDIVKEYPNDKDLILENRIKQMQRAAASYSNVCSVLIDVTDCKLPDGTEDWDAETPLVLNVCGHLDAVYGSEPSYKAYFDRAYPDAVYRCIDPERKEMNISATMVRAMSPEERKEWMV